MWHELTCALKGANKIRVFAIELCASLLVGGFPFALAFAVGGADRANDIVNALVAEAPEVVWFYVALLALPFICRFVEILCRTRLTTGKVAWQFLRQVTHEAGTGFQSIVRAAAGVAITFGCIYIGFEFTYEAIVKGVQLVATGVAFLGMSGLISVAYSCTATAP